MSTLRTSFRRHFTSALSIIAVLAIGSAVHAQSRTWIGSTDINNPGDWSNPANWTGGTVPQLDENVSVGTGTAAAFLDVSTPILENIIIGSGAADYLEIRPGAHLQSDSGTFEIGQTGVGTLVQLGGTVSSLVNQTNNALPGQEDNTVGNFNITNDGIKIGRETANGSLYDMRGGLLTLPEATLAVGNHGVATFLQTGGTVSTAVLRIGAQGTDIGGQGNGVYELKGGLLETLYMLHISRKADAIGELVISGGTLNALDGGNNNDAGGIAFQPFSGSGTLTQRSKMTIVGNDGVINTPNINMLNRLNATLEFQIDDDTVSTINVSRRANFDGTLNVLPRAGIALTKSTQWTLVTVAPGGDGIVDGTFTTEPTFANGLFNKTFDGSFFNMYANLDLADKRGVTLNSSGTVTHTAFAAQSHGFVEINVGDPFDSLTVMMDLNFNGDSLSSFTSALQGAGYMFSTVDPILDSSNNGTGIDYDIAILMDPNGDAFERFLWDLRNVGQGLMTTSAIAVIGDYQFVQQPQPQPQPQPTPQPGDGTVPEPTTAVLGVLAVAGLLGRRTRRA